LAWLAVYESYLQEQPEARAGELQAFVRWLSCPLLYQQIARKKLQREPDIHFVPTPQNVVDKMLELR
jgi:hypothetical protein